MTCWSHTIWQGRGIRVCISLQKAGMYKQPPAIVYKTIDYVSKATQQMPVVREETRVTSCARILISASICPSEHL
jgi:hypothetical protein